ncbi:MAG: hypothetical protein RJA70_4349 [Pseudomonadota bacterium]|jgi:hypothetical protein
MQPQLPRLQRRFLAVLRGYGQQEVRPKLRRLYATERGCGLQWHQLPKPLCRQAAELHTRERQARVRFLGIRVWDNRRLDRKFP